MNAKKKVVMFAGNGFDETEVKVPLGFLPKHGVILDVATVYREPDVAIKGKNGYPLNPTVLIADLRPENYDAVLIAGGYEGPDRVRGSEKALVFIREMNQRGKLVAAICHGPWVLCSADVLRGRNATCYPNMRVDLINAGASYQTEPVVVDGKLITADRPERSQAWCEAIVAYLKK